MRALWIGLALAVSAGAQTQIVIETDMAPQPFGRPGDSGSLIVDDQGRPVGLLFAGSASGGSESLLYQNLWWRSQAFPERRRVSREAG